MRQLEQTTQVARKEYKDHAHYWLTKNMKRLTASEINLVNESNGMINPGDRYVRQANLYRKEAERGEVEIYRGREDFHNILTRLDI